MSRKATEDTPSGVSQIFLRVTAILPPFLPFRPQGKEIINKNNKIEKEGRGRKREAMGTEGKQGLERRDRLVGER